MTLNGYYNEFDFIDALNNKYVHELSNSFEELLKKAFTKINCNDLLLCYNFFK